MAACQAKPGQRSFAVLMEEPTQEVEEGAIFSTTFYKLRVLCHERPLAGFGKEGSKEYFWRVHRRYSEFEELEEKLREAQLLPVAVALPGKTFFQHLRPSKAFAYQRSGELLAFLKAAVAAAEAAAESIAAAAAATSTGRGERPGKAPSSERLVPFDMSDVSDDLARFLGMEEPLVLPPAAGRQAAQLRVWGLPEDAEERTSQLVHSLNAGNYILGHLNPGPPSLRFRCIDKQATLGDVTFCCAEARNVAPLAASSASHYAAEKLGAGSRRGSPLSLSVSVSGLGSAHSSPTLTYARAPKHSSPMLTYAPPPTSGRCWTATWPMSADPLSLATPPQVATPPSKFRSPLSSLCSSPSASLLPSPICSPSQSRCPSPPRFSLNGAASPLGDEISSFASMSTISTVSTADTDAPLMRMHEVKQANNQQFESGVWYEVNVDTEWCKVQEHRRWWKDAKKLGPRADHEEIAAGKAVVKGAHRVASPPEAKVSKVADAQEKAKMVTQLEMTAALFRELSMSHSDLHPILGYGTDGRSFTMVQGLSNSRSLRTLPFTPQRCYRVLGQALKALLHLHQQHLPHGHLSPESLLVEDAPLGPQVRLLWAPGQRRPEKHTLATLGFRAPGEWGAEAGSAGDIWSLACVILVWWSGFSPCPHPWTQFAGRSNLQEEIHNALSEQPPALPQALLDLHGAAAVAEEPGHSFLSLLASMLTKCLVWKAADRPSASQLLNDRFFQSLAL